MFFVVHTLIHLPMLDTGEPNNEKAAHCSSPLMAIIGRKPNNAISCLTDVFRLKIIYFYRRSRPICR
ncbi:unnamed protein product, partial [Nesidiocoris tenuis]